MSYSSTFGQRIAMVLVLAAPVGLVHCGDDDGGGESPTATGGSSGKGGSATTGGSAGKATGGAPNAGNTGTGGSTGGGGAVTGGNPGQGGSGGAEAGAPGEGGSAGSKTGGGGAFGGEAGEPGEAGGTGEGGTGEGGGAGDGGGGETEAVNSILIGSFAPLPAYDDLEISGQALLVRTAEEETKVSVQVIGLLEDTEYPVHVHNLPCEFLAGTHYKIDPTEAGTVEANEVWPMFETNAAGVGMAEVTVDHWLRGDAMAVVVHDPEVDGNPKMACADLTLDSTAPLSAKGTFNGFAQSEDQDETLDGSVELEATEDGTELSYEISGFQEDSTEYMAHVHALPCIVTDAGGHYKLDPTVAETVEANELWLDLGSTEDGEAADSIDSEHRVRLDAQSVVLHRVVDDDTTLKVACAPLEVEAYPDILVEGTSVQLEAAEQKNLDDLQALASLRRTIAGATRVRVTAVGLGAGVSYPAHVHALPCSVESGGPHYKIDTSEADTVEENELWLMLAADADGAATSEQSFAHIARADARSIVIHDPEDSARLACIDLSP
jgi:hypothetical protein